MYNGGCGTPSSVHEAREHAPLSLLRINAHVDAMNRICIDVKYVETQNFASLRCIRWG